MNLVEVIIVMGLGEVGKPLYEIIKASTTIFSVYGYDIKDSISPYKLDELPKNPDYLHIAYPYSEYFVEDTLKYVESLKPRRLVIHSTVIPQTTHTLYERTKIPVAYSPVRGKHPNIKRHLMFWSKWISSYPTEEVQSFAEHLLKIGFNVKIAENPETLELAKLFETTYRAIMIAAWQEIHRLSVRFHADLSKIAEFIAEGHEVLHDRPVFYPDYIGGHCLIPNTKLLATIDHNNTLFNFVLKSNEERLEELKDEKVKREVEALKKIAFRLIPSWYFE
jgi:UDP-N-acetyl-D-mannosaminuronate dehydrogenase